MSVLRGQDETIVARATPPGQGAIGIIRLSGPAAKDIAADSLAVPGERLEPRRPRLGIFHDRRGEALDEVLVTWFPQPHSYTGEDVVEISCHGSPYLCRAILEECVNRGARPAEPGEFTRRAFSRGKLDLVQAEAVKDLVGSQTRFQAVMAREQLSGRLSKRLQPARDRLIDIVAHLETRLEFVEEDVDPESRARLAAGLSWIQAELERLTRDFGTAQTIQEGAAVVLAGRTNVGKSSIFNSLLRLDRAMVTEIPGTTRDALREWLDIGGLPVCLIDTAGIRKAVDVLELEGMNRSRRHLREADLILFVVDAAAGFGPADEAAFEAVRDAPYLLVINKTDLGGAPDIAPAVRQGSCGLVEISAKTGENLDVLGEAIRRAVCGQDGLERELPLVTNLRQKGCVEEAGSALSAGLAALKRGLSEEFVCYDLRTALKALGELTGEITTDDILGRIFSTFCIGK